ncbi:MAG: hypothetical protein FWC70_07955 [Defluviitaleaceae bacterium]|nr:hypothetical protein [Defluviitaleaceae bacterium]
MLGRCKELRRENDALQNRLAELKDEHFVNMDIVERYSEKICAMSEYIMPIVRNYRLSDEVYSGLKNLKMVDASYDSIFERNRIQLEKRESEIPKSIADLISN